MNIQIQVKLGKWLILKNLSIACYPGKFWSPL